MGIGSNVLSLRGMGVKSTGSMRKSVTRTSFKWALGPRLVVDGKALALKAQSARRTALCVLADGRIEVLVSSSPILAADLADFFVSEGCVDALNLDGGTSTQLYLRRAGIVVEEPGGVAVPVAVGLFVADAAGAEIVPRSGCLSSLGCGSGLRSSR